MRFDDTLPIYFQIMNDIKTNIIIGKLKEGEKIPSIRNYCTYYEVTSLTMQRAMTELEKEGILSTKKGIGSFVMNGISQKLKEQISKEKVKHFIMEMKNLGFNNEIIVNLIKEELKHECHDTN